MSSDCCITSSSSWLKPELKLRKKKEPKLCLIDTQFWYVSFSLAYVQILPTEKNYSEYTTHMKM